MNRVPTLLKEESQSGFVYPVHRTVTFERRERSRQRAFVNMNRDGQLRFIAERFSRLDTVELANIVRAIFGHPHDKGRPRKPK